MACSTSILSMSKRIHNIEQNKIFQRKLAILASWKVTKVVYQFLTHVRYMEQKTTKTNNDRIPWSSKHHFRLGIDVLRHCCRTKLKEQSPAFPCQLMRRKGTRSCSSTIHWRDVTIERVLLRFDNDRGFISDKWSRTAQWTMVCRCPVTTNCREVPPQRAALYCSN